MVVIMLRNYRKIRRTLIALFILVGFFLSSILPSVPVAKAFSTEITYSSGPGSYPDYRQQFSQNNGTYAKFGDNYAFMVGDHIGVYTASAVLVRDISFSASSISSGRIYALNSTHALVVYAEFEALQIRTVNIATGAIAGTGTFTTLTAYGLLSTIFKYGSDYYVFCDDWGTLKLFDVYPTPSTPSISRVGTTETASPFFIIPSQTDDSVFYLLGRAGTTGLRFRLCKYDFTGSTVTQLGGGAVDYDWSNYTVCMGLRLNAMGSYDLLVSYPSLYDGHDIFTTLIRFNDTYLNEWSIGRTASVSTPEAFVRPTRFGTQGQNSYNNLTDGLYSLSYIGPSYQVYIFQNLIDDIDTDTPFIGQETAGSLPEYPTRQSPYTSAQIGGLAPPEFPVGIWIDYTNKKFCADTYPTLWYTATIYVYTISIYDTVTHTYKTGWADIEVNRFYRFDITWTYEGSYNVQGTCTLSLNGTQLSGNNPQNIVNSRASFTFAFTSNYAGKVGVLLVSLFDSANAHREIHSHYLYINPSSTTTTTHTSTSTDGGEVIISQGVDWLLLLIVLAPAIALTIIGAQLSADAAVFLGLLGFGVSLGLNYNVWITDPLTGVRSHPIPDWIIIFLFVALTFAIMYGIFNRVKGTGGGAPSK
jgi:hypothetical protein